MQPYIVMCLPDSSKEGWQLYKRSTNLIFFLQSQKPTETINFRSIIMFLITDGYLSTYPDFKKINEAFSSKYGVSFNITEDNYFMFLTEHEADDDEEIELILGNKGIDFQKVKLVYNP